MKFAVVIPCWNEAASIARVINQVHPLAERIFVIDDGSADLTGEIAREGGATVLTRAENRGKGAALRNGLAAAAEAGFDWAFTMDGDGQHDPADMPKFIAAAAGADLVIGNRMAEAHHMLPVRRFVNHWMSRQIARRTGLNCPDSQCGFRLIRLGAWRELVLASSRFEIESEMTVAFAAAGFV